MCLVLLFFVMTKNNLFIFVLEKTCFNTRKCKDFLDEINIQGLEIQIQFTRRSTLFNCSGNNSFLAL